MSSNRMTEFTKTTFSLVGGMILVVGFVAWRSKGHAVAVAATASIPFGVLLFWAVLRAKIGRPSEVRQTRSVRPQPQEPVQINFGLGLHDNPLASLPSAHYERRILKPKDLAAEKERILRGRAPNLEPENLDQWHED